MYFHINVISHCNILRMIMIIFIIVNNLVKNFSGSDKVYYTLTQNGFAENLMFRNGGFSVQKNSIIEFKIFLTEIEKS
ncbi:hypothetical protein EP47_12025 [Legionella norrlandica]|uniref:Uncharacterized protein n=1 Tax=Legionella norrlandica TaxID=1498499 RepID=A0A0A2SVR1_9GAMM|nr:hypothetical protein EP47_12025 [Legionella norrlandica]